MERKAFLKTFRIAMVGHWVCLLAWIVYNCQVTRFLALVTLISWALITFYAFYMIFKHNPNFERQDRNDDKQ
jgi:hypothetical protein